MGFSSQEYWSGVLLPSPGLVTKSCPILATPWTVTCQAPPWDSPGKNTGVGSHFLLQGIFLGQESNPHLSCPPALAGVFFTTSATWEAPAIISFLILTLLIF